MATRNARLAALRSFFRFAALRHPEHAGLIQQILAIPSKRATTVDLGHLSDAEVDALVAAPARTAPSGVAATRCSCSPFEPSYASANSPASPSATSTMAPAVTSPAMAKDANIDQHHSATTPSN